MGARPLAVMDPLFFGPLDDPRQRWLCEGVVSGISSYGNSVGVPTVGGELTFDPCYAQNPLVNVLCLGALPRERLVLGRATGTGNLAVLLGSTTGRDGIGGVSVLASAGFSGDEAGRADDTKRPSVQVGDPYEEKRLIEACLELLDRGLVVGIQDLGGAGLACATSETAARGGMGMDVDVTAVPRREPAMEPWEVMTSESQERMLAIVTPAHLDEATAVCRKWEVRATVVGRVTDPTPAAGGPIGLLRVRDGLDGPVLAEVPAASLADDAPLYDRPMAPPADRVADEPPEPAADAAANGRDLLSLLGDAGWVYRQYDHQLFCNTVVGPGGDAALLRLAGPGLPPSERGIAVTTDSAPRWCALDPAAGVGLVLAEALANLACVGALPVAVVNCLNFGNPEHAEVMWQLSQTVDGLAAACDTFGLPVIGGNVSLYNESAGRDIDPTPVLGVLGLADQLRRPPPGPAWGDGHTVVVLGRRVASGGPTYPLGGSRWAVECAAHRGGTLAPLDAEAHTRTTGLVRELVAAAVGGADAVLSAVHDVSGGGLALAVAEMAAASGTGVRLAGLASPAELFSELAGRFVVAVSADRELATLTGRAAAAGVPCEVLGHTGGDRVVLEGPQGALIDLGVTEVSGRWRSALSSALGESG
jgi:phosphoribosylformylglycinamidine synthase